MRPYIVFCSSLLSVLDPQNTVYGIKHVLEIPLVEERAQIALNTLSARNTTLTRPSLLPPAPNPTTDGHNADPGPSNLLNSVRKGLPRVQFLTPPSLKGLPTESTYTQDHLGHSIQRPSSAQSTSSDGSNASDNSAVGSPVFKTLASRLSFWSQLSKRTNTSTSPAEAEFLVPHPQSLVEEQQAIDKMIHDNKETPGEVIDSILASTAPPPVTSEEKHSEMEIKIVRECIREFSKGGMYFAYNFGVVHLFSS